MEKITNAGKLTAENFCKLTGFVQPKKGSDPRGDAFCDNIWVEIKKKTLNQVRPYHYLTLVAYDDKTDNWYVIPPQDVIRLCLNEKKKLKKGQHTPNPMTCVGLGSIDKKCFQRYKVSVSELRNAIINSYQSGEQNTSYKNYAKEHEKKLQEDFLITQDQLLQLNNEVYS